MSWTESEWRDQDASIPRQAADVKYPRRDDSLILAMQGYLEGRDLSYVTARRFGWYPTNYRGPRVVIPCVRADGLNFWQARLMDVHPDLLPPGVAPVDQKRWESPFGARGDALCHLHLPGADTMVVVEGPMDALAAAATGASAIALLGVGASLPVMAHAASLSRAHYTRVILIPDRDEMGAWVRIQKELGNLGVVTQIREPVAKDLAAMAPNKRGELIYAA